MVQIEDATFIIVTFIAMIHFDSSRYAFHSLKYLVCQKLYKKNHQKIHAIGLSNSSLQCYIHIWYPIQCHMHPHIIQFWHKLFILIMFWTFKLKLGDVSWKSWEFLSLTHVFALSNVSCTLIYFHKSLGFFSWFKFIICKSLGHKLKARITTYEF